MDKLSFEQELKKRVGSFERDLERFLLEKGGPQATILEACAYSVRNGGKRVRPLFMECVYELMGGKDREALLPFMAAVEMIHSSSLVHDDLPCMDNDRLRRGKPSTWAKFGVDIGTLAGDGLMILAFETMLRSGFPADTKLEAVRILSEKSGICGMIGGQTVDVGFTGNIPDPDTLLYIYENKTAALIEASFLIGGAAAGARDKSLSLLSEAAKGLGLAFQIRDDILDVTSTSEQLGKSAHADDRNAKITWVTFYGLERSEADVKRLTDRALSVLGTLGEHEFLFELCLSLVNRRY